MKKHNALKKLTFAAMCMALYCVVMYFTQSFAFGAYQIRIATAIYSLGYFFPFLTVPMGLANAISNMIMGGLGVFDVLGGALAGILTTGACALIGKLDFRGHRLLVALPVTLIPGLLVPVWLAPALGMDYLPLAISLVIGQIIPGIVGAAMIVVMSRYNIKKFF